MTKKECDTSQKIHQLRFMSEIKNLQNRLKSKRTQFSLEFGNECESNFDYLDFAIFLYFINRSENLI